jgi:hypothetical protein
LEAYPEPRFAFPLEPEPDPGPHQDVAEPGLEPQGAASFLLPELEAHPNVNFIFTGKGKKSEA